MSTTRRLATLTLAATAALGLAACSTSIEAKGVPSQQEQTQPAEPPVQEAGDTDPAIPTETEPAETEPPTTTTTGDEDLPVPGDGVPGDAGLCQAVVGWFGYASLSLLATDDSGQVDPADVVPLLEALRDAPQSHQDASADLLALAADVSAATDGVIDQVQSGGDLYTAIGGLEEPVTAFGNGCTAAGVSF
jgi:hypothetical protein